MSAHELTLADHGKPVRVFGALQSALGGPAPAAWHEGILFQVKHGNGDGAALTFVVLEGGRFRPERSIACDPAVTP